MDILLNPNISYLLLAGGLMLAVLALAAPGTGVLEAVALGILALAGWGIVANQQILNEWALIVLALGAVLFVVALQRPRQKIWLPLSIMALIIGSVYIFQSPAWYLPAVNPFLAVLVSLLSAGFFWIAGRKTLEAWHARPRHVPSLIGQTGEAKTPVHKEGSVQVGGELWSAYSDQPIGRGAVVKVVSRDGFKIKVEQVI
jgi:membrane-bound serine protease (ClpP class)